MAWGAKLGSEDGDRLNVLASSIDAYEAAGYPVDPSRREQAA
jgi:HTH-type transcriptional regulator/antitoxin HigA